MRGNSHLIICRYGSPLDAIRSIAFLAKGLACSSVCRLSFGSDIHSRMIFRRVSCSGFMLKILCSKRWSAPIEVMAFIHGAGAVRLNHPRRDLVRSILSGFPSHSLESGGGAFLTVIFGQIFAYSAFSDSHTGHTSTQSMILQRIQLSLTT
jgi:hypothetical protein